MNLVLGLSSLLPCSIIYITYPYKRTGKHFFYSGRDNRWMRIHTGSIYHNVKSSWTTNKSQWEDTVNIPIQTTFLPTCYLFDRKSKICSADLAPTGHPSSVKAVHFTTGNCVRVPPLIPIHLSLPSPLFVHFVDFCGFRVGGGGGY